MNQLTLGKPEWQIISLREVESNRQLLMRNGFPCGSNNQQETGTPQLRPMNIDNFGEIDLQSVKFVEIDKNISGYLIKKNDVIFNNTNSKDLVGKTAIWNNESDRYVLSNHMTFLRFVEDGYVDSEFIARYFYYLWLNGYFQQIRRQHVNQASISLERLREIEIGLPPLPEQRAIAHVLRTVQAARESRLRELALERERKAALMEHLFTHGTRGEPTKQTEIGEMPESWEVIKLGDLCTFTTGKLNSEMAVASGRYPFFTCSKENFKIDSYSFDQEAILLAGNNAQGIYSVKYYKGKFDAYQRTYVITIRSTNQLNYHYLLYDLSRKLELLRRQSLGATTRFLTAPIIKNLDMIMPSSEEQQEIAGTLQSCDFKIAALDQEALLLDELFRAMLVELMTGRLSTSHMLIEGNNEDHSNSRSCEVAR